MSYNSVLLNLDLDAPVAPLLNFGLTLARKFEAALIAFAAADTHAFVVGDETGVLSAELLKQQRDEIEVRLKAMKEEFLAIAGDHEHTSWRGLLGDPTRLLAANARAADLVIAGMPPATPARNANTTVDLGTLALSAGRPVLIPSASLSPLRAETIVLAWKDTREARRAVSDALPLMKEAKEVIVLTIAEGDQKQARDSAADVVRFLMRHGVKTRADVMGIGGGDVQEAMSQTAREIGADLIVAGAYGHSRFREWAFGGVTRSLLADGSIHRLVAG